MSVSLNSEGPKRSDASRTVHCVVCREPIRPNAKKCIHCESFQDWRKYIGLSSSVLALLVALVSVVTLSVPIIKKALESDNSYVVVSLQSVIADSVFLIASNSGTKPGSIGRIELTVTNLMKEPYSVPLRVTGWGAGQTFISAGGSKQLELHMPRKPLVLKQHEFPKDLSKIKCDLKVEVIQFDGSKNWFEFDSSGEEYREFILAELVKLADA